MPTGQDFAGRYSSVVTIDLDSEMGCLQVTGAFVEDDISTGTPTNVAPAAVAAPQPVASPPFCLRDDGTRPHVFGFHNENKVGGNSNNASGNAEEEDDDDDDSTDSCYSESDPLYNLLFNIEHGSNEYWAELRRLKAAGGEEERAAVELLNLDAETQRREKAFKIPRECNRDISDVMFLEGNLHEVAEPRSKYRK